jgi:hypothetical protein
MSQPRGTFTEEQAWERSAHFAAPHCRRCHGQGTYWIYMGGEQSAIHLCHCVRNKAGFVPGIIYSRERANA